jgi:hypothetical protein
MEIVGLKQKVDNDINKLIAKFVGVKPHPFAKHIKQVIARNECCSYYDYIGLEHFPLNPIEIQIRWYAEHIKLFNKFEKIENWFLNQLKDKGITKEKQDFLRIRFLRMTERQKMRIIFKCNEKQRKMLGY